MTTVQPRSKRGRKPSSLRYYQDGPPDRVDVETWRLAVSGVGITSGEFSVSDIRSLPRVEENRRYVCVCNWSTRENWGGYLLSDVLRLAGWTGRTEGCYLRQTSIGTPAKGVYESTIPLGPALSRRCLLVDSIDGRPLPMERGYPLRLLDFGLYGYKSVKGLARLEITPVFERGEWEIRAGYTVDGEISPKRYRFCDTGTHHFIESSGEVTDI
ncbi:molybdopterin-dependent oxidoreductase [Kibdelosporangium aridum]|uniref:molybdopterin-dependent oxidoreductase n=1 Tax=Kibdelosporangium aridum TaxID=2030 RepID=UPI0035E6F88D